MAFDMPPATLKFARPARSRNALNRGNFDPVSVVGQPLSGVV